MRHAALVLALLLAACSDGGTAPGPGGVTVDEAEALDQAAEMLDSQRLPPEAVEGAEVPAPAASPAQ